MSLPPGQSVSHYRIVEKIGAGGMGEVYRAHDTRLHRTVAIKVLPGRSAADTRTRKTLRDEAFALSRLNHSNIATVHDLDSHEGMDLLVMEYIPGTTLRDLLRQGALPQAHAIDLGVQLLRGLAEAHEAGVLHRDLKPGNLRVLPGGQLKILDFGLAKLTRHVSETFETESLSEAHGAVGTLPYMAPEVLRGETKDSRIDIYGAGAVLYEMVTGQRAFPEPSRPQLIQDVLNSSPAKPTDLDSDISPELESICLKALAKDPDQRYRSAAKMIADLERVQPVPTGHQASSPPRSRRVLTSVLVVVTLSAVAALLWPALSERIWPRPQPHMEAFVTWPGEESRSRISPDNRWVSFISNRSGEERVWLRMVSGGTPQLLESPPGAVKNHVWAPDNERVGLILVRGGEAFFQVVPAFGGPPSLSWTLESEFITAELIRWIGTEVFLEVPARGLWQLHVPTGALTKRIEAGTTSGIRMNFDVRPDGEEVVYTLDEGSRSSLWRSAIDGTRKVQLTHDSSGYAKPHWLGRSGRQVVFSSNRSGQTDLWLLTRPRVGAASLGQLTFSHSLEYVEDTAADGSMLTLRELQDNANLWIVDSRAGTHEQVTADALQDFWPSASRDGALLAFQRARPSLRGTHSLFESRIVVGSLSSSRLLDERVVAADGHAALLSPSGKWLAYARIVDPPRQELWLLDLESGHRRCVSHNFGFSGLHTFPADWSRTNVAWSAGTEDLFFVERDESGREAINRVATHAPDEAPVSVVSTSHGELGDVRISANGLTYVYSEYGEQNSSELRLLDLETREDRVLLHYDHTHGGGLYSAGSVEPGSTIVLRTSFNSDWTENAEILAIDGPDATRSILEMERVFPATARLDPATRRLFITGLDAESVHNLHEIDLTRGSVKELTDNTVPGITFAGLEVLPDGRLLYVRHECNENIWLIRFDSEARRRTS